MQYVTLEALITRSLIIKSFYLAFRNPQLNIDLPSVESTCIEMIANGIINRDLKILISTNCKSDNVDFVTSDESNLKTPQRTPI